MTDIVDRLRHKSAVVPSDNTLCDEAADEIERLRGLLREAQTYGIPSELYLRIDAALAGTASQPSAVPSSGDVLFECAPSTASPRTITFHFDCIVNGVEYKKGAVVSVTSVLNPADNQPATTSPAAEP